MSSAEPMEKKSLKSPEIFVYGVKTVTELTESAELGELSLGDLCCKPPVAFDQ